MSGTGVQAAFHRLAVKRHAPMRDAQHMRSGAAQLARDPARLETMDRGKLGIRICKDGDLRLSAVPRRCQFRLDECQFRRSV
jgi:hypothetical protein